MNENTRLKNSFRNVFYGLIKYTITLICPFFIRTIFIYKFGVEYAGITSLFSSILSILSLSELGFSTAIVYALYSPVANNDYEKICALMRYFKKIYRVCGSIILIGGVVILPWLDRLISGEYPKDVNIYLIYFIFLMNTVVSYIFYGYKSALFSANQREDILSKAYIISNLIVYVCQLIVLFFVKNYYCYTISTLIGTVVNNLLIKRYYRKFYSTYICKGILSWKEKKKIYQDVGALFGHQLDMVVINSSDNVVVSAFLGLQILSIYNNYQYIVSSVLSILIMLSSSFIASIGNSIVIESKEKNYKDFELFTYVNGILNGVAGIILLVLFQDFMKIWMGEQLLLKNRTMFLMVLVFWTRQFRRPVLTYKTAAGIWKRDWLKPYIAALTNILLNIIMVKIWGIDGVMVSTIFSMVFIEIPWEIYSLFSEYFQGKIRKYLNIQIKIAIRILCISAITYYIMSLFEVFTFSKLIIKGILSSVLVIILLFVFSIRDYEFKFLYNACKNKIIEKII